MAVKDKKRGLLIERGYFQKRKVNSSWSAQSRDNFRRVRIIKSEKKGNQN